MSRDAKDTVYCRFQMPLAQGEEFMKLVLELRASGAHGELEAVFTEMIEELQGSIDFVQEMLRGLEATTNRSPYLKTSCDAQTCFP